MGTAFDMGTVHIRTFGNLKVPALNYEQREYRESEMEEILGVRDLFKEEADGQKDS